MGEATNKIDREDSHNQVVQLRSQIEMKRAALTAEFDELNRRRAVAVVKAKSGARAAGFAAVGLICAASVLNAVMDLFRDESREAAKDRGSPFIVSMATNALRWAALQYLAQKFAEVKTDLQRPTPSDQIGELPLLVEQEELIVIKPI